jgi:3',5'-cyclic AMP phosphodiesterase CpdA
MPIHLPPLSRRQFIAGTFAASAALVARSPLFGAERPVDEHTWALISDPHIAADRAKIAREINMAAQLERVVDDVLRQPRRPVGALINGDLAFNTGESADYGTFAELVRPLRTAGLPLTLALGNHDNRERFWAALSADKSVVPALDDRQVAIVPTPRANWFMLDSLEKTMSTPGLLGAAQLAWLATALDAHADKPALVMTHHNPSLDPAKINIRDEAAFFDVIRPRRHVKAYFFGHSHRWSVERDASGLHLINLPTTAYPFDKAQPIGWTLAQLEPRGMRLELRCLDSKRADHGQKVELAWRS